MGMTWDSCVPGVDVWIEAIRVAKPGCHLLAFGGTRTFHRLMCAIEDAGWEIRDTLMWVHGSGFPKSHDVSKAIDKAAGAERKKGDIKRYAGQGPEVYGSAPSTARGFGVGNTEDGDFEAKRRETYPATDIARQWQGWGTALKPAWEPIIVAMKPLDGTFAQNAQKWGVAGLNIDGGRVGIDAMTSGGSIPDIRANNYENSSGKPRLATPVIAKSGRWPANLIHDGSEEVLELFPDVKTGEIKPNQCKFGGIFGNNKLVPSSHVASSGSAARFFYCAKASRAEREMGCEGMPYKPGPSEDYGTKRQYPLKPPGEPNIVKPLRNHHPTVKPLALMRYLCRLVTPPNGVILDPFMGSGTTGMAARLEGFRFIGIEKEAEYVAIAKRRIEAIA